MLPQASHVRAEAGEYQQALEDYKAGGDAASMVRILLGPLQQPDAAAELARHAGNQAALRQVADYLLSADQPQVCSLSLLQSASADSVASLINVSDLARNSGN